MFHSLLSERDQMSLGEMGERAAVKFLRKKRYKIADRNVRYPEGEIDIVAVDGRTVVFVEVKTRQSVDKGEPWEAVDVKKQKKIIETSTLYLKDEELTEQNVRYDIVSVTWENLKQPPKIEHLENAFEERDS